MQLAQRCKKCLGEVLIVVNVDASKTYRDCSYHKGETVEQTFKRNIETIIHTLDYHPYFTNFTNSFPLSIKQKPKSLIWAFILHNNIPFNTAVGSQFVKLFCITWY